MTSAMTHPIDWSVLLGYVAAFALGYLCGSIPFGVLLTRLAGAGDIRAIGSGNIGATNVLRTGRKALAAATLLGDMLKGTVPVLLADHFFGRDMAIAAAFGAFFGHLFPIWLGFKGGKGVATYIGLMIGFKLWWALIAFCTVWAAVAALTRYSSLAGLVGGLAVPGVLSWRHDAKEAQVFLLLTLLVWFTHRANIARLVRGTESKIGERTGSGRPS